VALHVDEADRVERDVGAAGLGRHRFRVPLDRLLVERGGLSAVPPASAMSHATASTFASVRHGEEDPRPLAREGAADRTTTSVADRVLALE